MASVRVLLSYSAEGQIPIELLRAGLSPLGLLSCDPIVTIARYRPNAQAGYAGATVKEYLLTLQRSVAESVRDIEA